MGLRFSTVLPKPVPLTLVPLLMCLFVVYNKKAAGCDPIGREVETETGS
jgi:hypothetical protein